MNETLEVSSNPYVGPRTFFAEQRKYFHGRKREIAILKGLVMSRRTVLFFAQSGAGKSSLLRAGLIPELTETVKTGRGPQARTSQRMRVLPILTLSSGIPRGMKVPITNIFIFAALSNLYPPDADCDELADLTLEEGLAPFLRGEWQDPAGRVGETLPDNDRPVRSPTLLIFDQFEELFTFYPDKWDQWEGFFQQVNQALVAYPDLRVLFSMREDFIAELTPYANLLPNGLRDRFRLELLKPEAALQAITEPARLAGRTFVKGAAEALVDNLRRGQSGRRQQTGSPAPKQPLGAYVEPVHLQIVCRRLWDQLPADQTVIQTDDQDLGDVDQALIDFYEATLKEVYKDPTLKQDLNERHLRRWFDEELITPAHTRGLVYRDEKETVGLPNAAVDILREAYILRARVRGVDTWYELAHDRMVEPIIEANRRWGEAWGAVLADAERWQAEKRAPQYLYEGRHLKKELAAMESKGPIPIVQEFLEAGKKSGRRRRRRFYSAVIIVMIAIVGGFNWILRSENKAVRQAARMTIHYKDEILVVTDPEVRSFRYPIYVFSLAGDSPQLSDILEGHQGEIFSAAISPDKRYLATVSYDASLRLWDLEDPDNVTGEIFFVHPEDTDLTAVAFSPSGDHIAWGDWFGTVRVYDFIEREEYSLPQHQGPIHTLSFSPDEHFLFVVADANPEEIAYYSMSDLAAIDPEGSPNYLELEEIGN